MQRGNVITAGRPLHDGGERIHGRAAADRSTVYLNGQATRLALRRHRQRAECRLVLPHEVLPTGAHLLTPRRGYTHHGIYVGNGRVVHYAGLVRARVWGPIEEVSLEEFADGQHLFIKVGAEAAYPADAIVARARSRLGENRYRITTNNCEHFCEWCLRGESRSEQVERWFALPRKLASRIVASIRLRLASRRAGAGTAAS